MFRNILIIVGVFGLGWGASFGAGMAYGQRQSPATATGGTTPSRSTADAPNAQASSSFTGGGFGGGQGGQGGQGGRVMIGTVAKVDGSTVTMTTADSQTVSVTVSDQTQVMRPAPIKAADLATGTRISVSAVGGTPAPGAPVIAQSIAVIPEGQGGQGGQGGRSGPQGGTGGRQG